MRRPCEPPARSRVARARACRSTARAPSGADAWRKGRSTSPRRSTRRSRALRIPARDSARRDRHDRLHRVQGQPGMHRISLLGVAIGNVVDIVATNIVALPVMIYVFHSSASAVPPDSHAAAEILLASSTFRIWSSILGALCSVLGGYVAARIAKHDEVLNGALSSILCTGFGLYAVFGGS